MVFRISDPRTQPFRNSGDACQVRGINGPVPCVTSRVGSGGERKVTSLDVARQTRPFGCRTTMRCASYTMVSRGALKILTGCYEPYAPTLAYSCRCRCRRRRRRRLVLQLLPECLPPTTFAWYGIQSSSLMLCLFGELSSPLG
jgi:hypothetical protein